MRYVELEKRIGRQKKNKVRTERTKFMMPDGTVWTALKTLYNKDEISGIYAVPYDSPEAEKALTFHQLQQKIEKQTKNKARAKEIRVLGSDGHTWAVDKVLYNADVMAGIRTVPYGPHMANLALKESRIRLDLSPEKENVVVAAIKREELAPGSHNWLPIDRLEEGQTLAAYTADTTRTEIVEMLYPLLLDMEEQREDLGKDDLETLEYFAKTIYNTENIPV